MPNIKSAKKRVLINDKKNLRNRMALSAMKTAIRKVNDAMDTNNIALAEELLPSVFSIIDKTASKGIIHVNKAANHKSQLASKIHAIKIGKLVITIKKTNEQIAAEKAKAAKEIRDAQKAEQTKKKAEKEAAKEQAAKDAKGKKTKVTVEKEDKKTKPTKDIKKETKPVKEDKKPKETKTETKKDTKVDKKAETTTTKAPKKEDKKTEDKKAEDKKAEKPKKETKPKK
jgi:small subunit ribosomal protein S20